jgi:hypothetical protein
MEYPRPTWTQTFTSTMDLSGAPVTVVGPDEKLYFAVSSKGLFAGTLTSTYSIFIGCVNGAGVTEWVFQDASILSSADDTQPTLAIGPSGELYVAFMTPGNIPGTYNGADVVSLCDGCSSTGGRQDIVLARINGATVGNPSVAWRIQNAYLNSCSNEYSPQMVIDSANNQLVLVYQCSGATLCSPSIGSPNIVCTSFTLQGSFQWAYQGNLMNGAGANRNPSVAVDLSGNIYVAYTITTAVSGGGILQGTEDVEIIRLRRTGGLVYRDWIFSATNTINSTGINTDPNIVFDPKTHCLYVAFTATQAVPGGVKSAPGADLVVVALTTDGQLESLRQSAAFNQPAYFYSTMDHPRICVGNTGTLYIAAHTILQSTGNDMVLAFKLNPGTGKGWFFRQGVDDFGAYLVAADIPAPFQVLQVAAPFSPPAISNRSGYVYISFLRYNSATFYVTALSQNVNYLEYNAQQYMRNIQTICGLR